MAHIHFPSSRRLPLPLTALIGREHEVAALVALVRREEMRLLILSGPGDVGKTRLALEVAAAVAESFPDGIWFVGLGAITDPELVASTVAEALDVRESRDHPIADRLRAFLGEKKLLLLLDIFEHVVEAAPLVAELLGGSPGLTVLVTSRSRLRVSGEHEHAVRPLSLTFPGESIAADSAVAPEAVRLVIERGQAVKEVFTLTSDNVSAVAQICGRLDRQPLAIELAARVKILPPAALLARPERRLPLLTGGRDLPSAGAGSGGAGSQRPALASEGGRPHPHCRRGRSPDSRDVGQSLAEAGKRRHERQPRRAINGSPRWVAHAPGRAWPRFRSRATVQPSCTS